MRTALKKAASVHRGGRRGEGVRISGRDAFRRRLATVIALALTAIGTIMVLVPTAQAAERATHYGTHLLRWSPHNDLANICLPARRIFLAADTYSWSVYFGGQDWRTKSIRLAEGWYYWGACLDPRNEDYEIFTSLDPEKAGLPTAHNKGIATMYRAPDRVVTWGSYLDR
jgi:hypothetical protein